MQDKLILFMYESWAELDRATEGLSRPAANAQYNGGSRIAWTVGHVTNMVDSWLNVRFQGLAAHPLIGDSMFRTGANGEAPDWLLVLDGVSEVRQVARRLLDMEPAADLDRRIAYEGSIPALRSSGLSLRYALMRISAHHFMHAGEIATVRARLGHRLPETSDWGVSLL